MKDICVMPWHDWKQYLGTGIGTARQRLGSHICASSSYSVYHLWWFDNAMSHLKFLSVNVLWKKHLVYVSKLWCCRGCLLRRLLVLCVSQWNMLPYNHSLLICTKQTNLNLLSLVPKPPVHIVFKFFELKLIVT